MPLQKVLSGYRITLPEKFREANGISEGDMVSVEESDSALIVRAVEVKVKPK